MVNVYDKVIPHNQQTVPNMVIAELKIILIQLHSHTQTDFRALIDPICVNFVQKPNMFALYT